MLPYVGGSGDVFEVVVNGAGLRGDDKVVMKKGRENNYYIEYLPFEVGQEKGSVIFINNDLG